MTARRSVWKSSVSFRYREDHRFFAVIGLEHIKQTFAVINNLRAVTSVLLLVAILWAGLAAVIEARAQEIRPGVVDFGDLVVTGASGTLPPPANPPLPPGVNELDETFIDPGGASLKVFDVRNPGGPPEAQLINAPVKFQVPAGDIGQVFGLALDDANPPNIYAAATPVHGLHIVVPDADGDGRPERLKLGQPGAQWMEGQFGVARGGGPGTVWKINGETGDVTKFADVLTGGTPNSGSGLGNITYDAKRKQLFVSDLDTGLIHRLDMTGANLGAFDHGVQGRPANGMATAADDGVGSDITSPSFDAEDSGTWGMAAPPRRVWGLAVRGDRLYYAVEEGPQAWSVGINEDGGFGSDPRWELDVPSDPNAYPVSDIAFTGKGEILLAQRGDITSRYDYSQYHTPRKTRVLRYRLESPDDPATPSRWVAAPEDYAIGFPGNYRNTSGGIAIGYGYKKNDDGSYGLGSCEGTLWSTGDALRDNPVHGAKLAQGGPLNVHGLQGNALNLVRPQNEPPWASYFVDYDGQFDDPQASGHVGDVEIPRECKKPQANLQILKKAVPELCTAGNQCTYTVEIENVGDLPYTGPLVLHDIAEGGAKLVSHSPPPPAPGWDCKERFPGFYECTHPPVTLAPGDKTTLELTFELPPWWDRYVYKNCVELPTPGYDADPQRYNNRSCDYVRTVTPEHPRYVPDLQLEKFGVYGNCDIFGVCHFVIRVTNVGAADYTGPLHIHETIAQPAAVLVDWAPKIVWNCGPVGGNAFDCTHAPVTLSPGEFREVHVWIAGPPLGLGHTDVRNCAWIDWQGAPHDFNPGNEYDCAAVSIFPPGHPLARPRLAIEKDAIPNCINGVGPGGGWLCLFRVIIRNSGGAPYLGPFSVTDTQGGGATGNLVNHQDSPPWTCVPGGGVGPYTCTRPPVPGGLQPGDSRPLYLDFEVPAAVGTPNVLVNCARTSHDNDGDGVPENLESCHAALICTPGAAGDCPDDLALTKWAQPDPCWPGFPCVFQVIVHNLGTVDQPAGLVITDVPNPDVGALTVTWPPAPAVTCVPAGPNHTCTVNDPVVAGAGVSIALEFVVPPAYPWTTLENCASIAPSAVNMLPFNDEDCGTAYIPGPDLAPFGGTECERGVPCPLDVSVDNKGQRPFKGAAGLKGTLSPGVPITSISSQTPGFSCSVTGNGTYQCKGDNLTLEPGASAKLKLTILVPENFQGTRISHIKDMVWPDQKVKDRNPENDQHISIITIKQPKEPAPPPPPPPPAGAPDLAVTKTANQNTCLAGQPCGFSVTAVNVGSAPYVGPLRITDITTPGGARLTKSGPPPWSCRGGKGRYTCTHPSVTLVPGASRTLSLTFASGRGASGSLRNCAELTWTGGRSTRQRVRAVQQALNEHGINIGTPDGKIGSKTRRGIRTYQKKSGLPVTGRIDDALIASLIPGWGRGDANPGNDRSCATSAIQIVTPPPPTCYPPRIKNRYGQCVCPSNKPIWTGQTCIPRPPEQCTGGRYRDNKGQCVCPSSKPIWTGQICIPREIVPPACTGGRYFDQKKRACVCPSNKPVWNGQICVPKPPQQCTGGRVRNNKGQCVCPSSKPVWTGQICIPKITVCSGGRVFSLSKKKCVCPSNKPVWNGQICAPRLITCSGGRVRNNKGQCVCPSNKPIWTGQFCIPRQTTTPPPSGPSEISCSGGRVRNNKGQCVCPSSRPMWTGQTCVPAQIQINPNLKLKIPQLQLKKPVQ